MVVPLFAALRQRMTRSDPPNGLNGHAKCDTLACSDRLEVFLLVVSVVEEVTLLYAKGFQSYRHSLPDTIDPCYLPQHHNFFRQ